MCSPRDFTVETCFIGTSLIVAVGFAIDLNKLCLEPISKNSVFVIFIFVIFERPYPYLSIIDKAINSTINKFFQFNRQNDNKSPGCSYVKLRYVGKFSAIAQKRFRRTIQRFCDNSFNIKLVFSSCKIGSLFSVKDLIPKELKSCVVYRFRCAGCGACYVGEAYFPFVNKRCHF